MLKTKNKSGFTLIELLVVIAIIGLLATLSVVALNNARERARDSRRVSDVKQIQTALELYFNANDSYPTVEGTDPGQFEAGADQFITGVDGTVLLSPVPEPPTPDDCTSNTYTYTSHNSGANYCLEYCLANNTGGIDAAPTIYATDMTINAGSSCPY